MLWAVPIRYHLEQIFIFWLTCISILLENHVYCIISSRAASTYSYQNEKHQAELELEEASLYLRKPLRASPLYRVSNLHTPELQAFFEAPTTWDICLRKQKIPGICELLFDHELG
uniref:Putative ovule protein n=1 Tax=Solanum chacoense TaxID=4108 RepID=A0A0V0H6B8_SOLCH